MLQPWLGLSLSVQAILSPPGPHILSSSRTPVLPFEGKRWTVGKPVGEEVRSAAKHQSGTSSNHVGGSKASRAGPSPPGPLPGSHIGASQPSPASHSGLSP
ncbi:uncharacterized protein LOC110432302 [Sorghum bicolor]|uniref:uncharacterized protein LOC110432302 n=1 Tax=Sorghum bicolor TaxID=4558 RepID=UPI000B4266BC|nr:uncharacterized protein LOC110432302 [Sorghum bicolor]|eukprot:XP_021308097.1 uncharacterized protein LOC110432302 [Sorghum bicolor]